MAMKMKVATNKDISFVIFVKTCISLKAKQNNECRHFFMNSSG